MSKAEWVKKATDVGIENAEAFTVAELQVKIAETEGSGDKQDPPPPSHGGDADALKESDSKEDTNASADKQQEVKPGYKYPVYDLWKVDVSVVRDSKGDPTGKVTFTAIKKLRENVKIEASVATELNLQSHNSLRRYYSTGSITNGNEESANIK